MSGNKSISRFLIFGLSAALVTYLGVSAPAYAQQDTTINASLFSATEPPEVTVTSPIDGEVVHSGSILISGTTVNATTVDIYVNGVHVAALNTTMGAFSYMATLQLGENEIRIEGFSTYSNLESLRILTVTYEQDTDPGPDDPDDGTSGNNSGGGGSLAGSGDSQLPRAPNTGFFSNLIKNLNFSNQHESFVKPLGSWLLTLIAIGVLIVAMYPKAMKKHFIKNKNTITNNILVILRVALILVAAIILYLAQL